MGGKNEEIVGKALKGRRDRVYLATKIQPASVSKAAIFKDVETSLKTLETDYIDVIQLHTLPTAVRIFWSGDQGSFGATKRAGKGAFLRGDHAHNQVQVLNALMEDKDRFFWYGSCRL